MFSIIKIIHVKNALADRKVWLTQHSLLTSSSSLALSGYRARKLNIHSSSLPCSQGWASDTTVIGGQKQKSAGILWKAFAFLITGYRAVGSAAPVSPDLNASRCLERQQTSRNHKAQGTGRRERPRELQSNRPCCP